MITIDRVGDRIHLTSPYSTHTIACCKRVAGANWSKRARAWTFPLTIESCLRLRQEFGKGLEIGMPLQTWYRAEADRRAAQAGLAAGGVKIPLERLGKRFPILHEAVTVGRPYQAVGAQFAVNGRAVLIAEDPGLGKTLETLAAVAESGVPGPYLVVSPKTAATTVWPYEIPRWCPGQSAITLPEGRPARDAVLTGLLEVYRQNAAGANGFTLEDTWVSVHPEAVLTKSWWVCEELETGSLAATGAGLKTVCGFRHPYTKKPTSVLGCGHKKPKKVKREDEHVFPQLFGIEWGAIVVDECHESLVRKSGTPTQRRLGLEMLRLREGGLRIAVSGTPLRNKPWQLWGTLNWLRPDIYSGFWRWAKQYWQTGGFSGYELGELIEGREKMLWDEVGSIVLRRTKAEVASDLPPKTYVGTPLDSGVKNSPVGIWLTMSKQQARAYTQMAKNSAAEVLGGTVNANGILAELTRLQQLASAYGSFDGHNFSPNPPSNKMDWIEQFLEEMGIPSDPSGKVIIVSQYTKLLKMLSFGLSAAQGGMSCMLTGEITGPKRKAVIDAFNQPSGSDSPHIMFLQVKAGGVAITIDSADHMIMVDEADPDTMTQVEDRLHRVSNPRPVFYYYLRSLGTVDVTNAVVNSEVAATGRRLLDERRGVEFYRRVLEESRG